MHKPQFVTFTGVDDQTFIPGMVELAQRYPIEWGVLIGGKIGKNRYPSSLTLTRLRAAVREQGLQLSMHLCNGGASNVNIKGDPPGAAFLRGFGRVQVNALWYDMPNVVRAQVKARMPFIIQHRDGPFPPLPSDVYALHDCSGGKGKLPKDRPEQRHREKLVGYAGGITPENVGIVMLEIDATNYWLDMETGVRTNDWFDLDKCAAVCRAIWPEM